MINYIGTTVSNVIYTSPNGTITKAFTYNNGLVTSIAIFGPGATGTFYKNLTYVGTSISGASYSVF